jgi:hypothetical protein
MPRASRHFAWLRLVSHPPLPPQSFLLKVARDRRRYLRWLFEAKKRFDLSALNYMVSGEPHSSPWEYRSDLHELLITFARVSESDDSQLRRQHDPTLGP